MSMFLVILKMSQISILEVLATTSLVSFRTDAFSPLEFNIIHYSWIAEYRLFPNAVLRQYFIL